MAGWLYFIGFICFVPMTMSGVGFLAADLLNLSPKLWILFFFIDLPLNVVRAAAASAAGLILDTAATGDLAQSPTPERAKISRLPSG
jgi:hypothetical protein